MNENTTVTCHFFSLNVFADVDFIEVGEASRPIVKGLKVRITDEDCDKTPGLSDRGNTSRPVLRTTLTFPFKHLSNRFIGHKTERKNIEGNDVELQISNVSFTISVDVRTDDPGVASFQFRKTCLAIKNGDENGALIQTKVLLLEL